MTALAFVVPVNFFFSCDDYVYYFISDVVFFFSMNVLFLYN